VTQHAGPGKHDYDDHPARVLYEAQGRVFHLRGARLHGVSLEALIKPTGRQRNPCEGEARHPNSTWTKNHVQVTLAIGDDSGTRPGHGPHFPLKPPASSHDPVQLNRITRESSLAKIAAGETAARHQPS